MCITTLELVILVRKSKLVMDLVYNKVFRTWSIIQFWSVFNYVLPCPVSWLYFCALLSFFSLLVFLCCKILHKISNESYNSRIVHFTIVLILCISDIMSIKRASSRWCCPCWTVKCQRILTIFCFWIIDLQIEQLQLRLQEEKSMRTTLERAMGRASSTLSPGHRHFTAQVQTLLLNVK